jgi:hypothetical protein
MKRFYNVRDRWGDFTVNDIAADPQYTASTSSWHVITNPFRVRQSLVLLMIAVVRR